MLTTEEFRTQIQEWMKQGRYDLIRISSKKRLEARGYIDLGAGSFVRWIEPDWFEEAKKRGVVSQDIYGQWIPIGYVEIEEVVTGKRGQHVITETKEHVNTDRYEAFMKEYKEFSEKKRGREYYAQKEKEENQQLVQQFTI